MHQVDAPATGNGSTLTIGNDCNVTVSCSCFTSLVQKACRKKRGALANATATTARTACGSDHYKTCTGNGRSGRPPRSGDRLDVVLGRRLTTYGSRAPSRPRWTDSYMFRARIRCSSGARNQHSSLPPQAASRLRCDDLWYREGTNFVRAPRSHDQSRHDHCVTVLLSLQGHCVTWLASPSEAALPRGVCAALCFAQVIARSNRFAVQRRSGSGGNSPCVMPMRYRSIPSPNARRCSPAPSAS
jgi:hypothetical protein